MAIYHCSIQVVGRSAGRSSVAAAAYRSGTKLTSMYDGVTSDYTKKSWIEFTEIRLPEQAPKEYLEREKLWNAVEMSEKSRDSQLAREVELALPIEMNLEQQIELVREYVDHNFVKAGMCADIAIHNPPLTDDRHRPINEEGKPTKNQDEMIFRNPHAHILLTVRPIDDNGKWESKSQKEYLCIRGNEEKGFTSEEFKIQKDNGWHKQFRYYTPENTKVWLDEMTANRLELKRVDRNPKCSQYGRKNPTVEYWNQKERVEEWRKEFERAKENGASVYLLVENGSWDDIISDKYRSWMDTRTFMGNLTMLQARYDIKIVFVNDYNSGIVIKNILYHEAVEMIRREESKWQV